MGELVFGPYFLVPFGFAVGLLVMELGLVARSRMTTSIAMAIPIVLVLLAGIGHRPDAIYANSWNLRIATRRHAAVPDALAAGGFYLFAWLRNVAFASEGLTAALVALAFARPETLAVGDFSYSSAAPLIAAWSLQFGIGLWRREAWRWGLLGDAGGVGRSGGVAGLPDAASRGRRSRLPRHRPAALPGRGAHQPREGRSSGSVVRDLAESNNDTARLAEGGQPIASASIVAPAPRGLEPG